MAMGNPELHLARSRLRARIDSLRSDIHRCFWPIGDPGAPAPAPFPALMYCFATLDYLSSFWRGWNKADPTPPPNKENQTQRMTEFLVTFLLYPRKESRIAIDFWRHKLMHTSEPRQLRSKPPLTEVYEWLAGVGVQSHMFLQPISGRPGNFILGFDCNASVRDLDAGVFGPAGYFPELRVSPALQQKYLGCLTEMHSYEIDLNGI